MRASNVPKQARHAGNVNSSLMAVSSATAVNHQGHHHHLATSSRPQTTAANNMRPQQHQTAASSSFTRQGQNTQSSGVIRRGKVRSVNNQHGHHHQHQQQTANAYYKRQSSYPQPAGVYGISGGQNQQMQSHLTASFNNQQNTIKQQQAQQQQQQQASNIKEVMNTSAPICISSYIKGGANTQTSNNPQNNQRPMTKAASRRQASFGHAAAGGQQQHSATQGNSRRSGASTTQNTGGSSGHQNVVGMVSGQTMNLSRTTKDAANISIVNNGNGNGASRGQQHSSHGMVSQAAAMHTSNSATPIMACEADIVTSNNQLQQSYKVQPYSNASNKSGTHTSLAQYESNAQQFKQQNTYNEEDGFMRGARIAEKIQEFYHTTTAVVPSGGFTSGSQTLQLSAGPVTQSTGQVQVQSLHAANKTVTVASRADLHSQGGHRGSKMRLNDQLKQPQMIIGGGAQHVHNHHQQATNTKPRATSAYGSHNSRRNLNAHMIPSNANERMGTHQKAIISSMKERKMQMRAIGGQTKGANANSNFTGTVFNEPTSQTKVIGIGHGFGTQRPASRDSRMRHPFTNNNKQGGAGKATITQNGGGSSLNATQTSHKQQVNNFFSLGSATNSKTGVGLNSSIGNISNVQRAVSNNPQNVVTTTNENTPKSQAHTMEQQRLQSYLRSSGQHTEMLKIQDLVTNASQDNRYEIQDQMAQHASGFSNVTSSDIRQIKLNYLQHNKRHTMQPQAKNQSNQLQQTNNQQNGGTKRSNTNQQHHLARNEYISAGCQEDIIIQQNDGNIHKIVSGGVAKSQPRNFKVVNCSNGGKELYRTQDVPNISNVRPTLTNKEQSPDEGNQTLILAKAPQIQARDINRMGNTAKPLNQQLQNQQQQQNQMTTVQQYAAANAGKVFDRHPLDKAQVYKSEGQPDQEVIEFCTANSTIENLDNYFIGKRIGQGAYAVVRLGLHKMLNQKIAVKIYEKIKLMEPNRRKSVKREMKIMEKLDHPNIAKLYEAFESHKQVFLIMEFVNGGSLHGYLKMKPNRQMPELEAKFLWRQVVQAIHYCHQRNVTHRDIKLENILLDETKERVKMIDFGFSTCIPHERKVKIFCGTPSYMAPEIVSKIEYSGPPADIWALGVLLYALLCGKFPFRGQNDKELYNNIRTQDLQFPDHVSPHARMFLSKLFNKTPERRLSAKQILQDPWTEISQQELEILSPNFMSFAKQAVDQAQPVGSFNQTQRLQSSSGTRVAGRSGQQMIINPQNIEFAKGLTNSQKDKRLTMFPEDIKKFVIDQNKEKVVLKEFDTSKRNQDIRTKVTAPSAGNYGTAPAGSNSRAMVSQNNKNLASITTLQSQLTGQQTTITSNNAQNENTANQQIMHQHHGTNRSGTAAPSGAKRNKINMEAYQAYYNTNEASSNNATQVIQPTKNTGQQQAPLASNQSDNPYPLVETNTVVVPSSQAATQQSPPQRKNSEQKKISTTPVADQNNDEKNAEQQTQKQNDSNGYQKRKKSAEEADETAEGADNKSTSNGDKKDPKIINNIVHIDQKGANINITNVTNHQTFVIYANHR